MVGLEALHLQGLPIDELLLTRETEDQLADLAGNAMSTTVVGTTILVALVLSMKYLTPGNDKRTYEEKHGTRIVDEDEDIMEVENPFDSVQDHIFGEDQLAERPFDLSKTTAPPLPTLLEDAMKSVRFCTCEGRKDMTEREVRRCDDCGFTACVKCGGRPEHNSQTIDVKSHPRLPPSVFERSLKSALPMCLDMSGITEQLLDSLKRKSGTAIPSKRWEIWRNAVLEAVGQELRFVELKRQELWYVTYESTKALAELCLHPKRPEWLFYAKPSPSEPANAEIRKLLMNPVARLACDESLLGGKWEVALPHPTSVEISIKGVGEPVPSWESRLGLLDPKFVDSTIFPQLEVSVPHDDVDHFDRDISGTYVLLDKCGTANSALHKKIPTKGDKALPSLFLLLDPTRSGKPSDDAFVFSTSIRRLEYQETRPIFARLHSSWRQSSKDGPQRVSCTIPQKYVFADGVKLKVRSSVPVNLSILMPPYTPPHRLRTPREHTTLFLGTTSASQSARMPASRQMPCLSRASHCTHKLAQSGLGVHGKKLNRSTSVPLSVPCRGCWSVSKSWMALSPTGKKSNFQRITRIASAAPLLPLPYAGSNKGRKLWPSKTVLRLANMNAA